MWSIIATSKTFIQYRKNIPESNKLRNYKQQPYCALREVLMWSTEHV